MEKNSKSCFLEYIYFNKYNKYYSIFEIQQSKILNSMGSFLHMYLVLFFHMAYVDLCSFYPGRSNNWHAQCIRDFSGKITDISIQYVGSYGKLLAIKHCIQHTFCNKFLLIESCGEVVGRNHSEYKDENCNLQRFSK